MAENNSVGTVETQYYAFADSPDELLLESGEKLGPITLAYETYGRLDEAKSNAILIVHALSGDAHAAGYHEGDRKPGWWDTMIGPGKAFDTDRYFVVCSNILGGCMGSTGPSSVHPKTGRPYGLEFPMITIQDMVHAQRHLIDHLGIEKLLAVAGGSMGGMQVLEWAVSYPERIRAAIPIATAIKHSPQQIAFNEVGRQAIMADADWKEGDYYEDSIPANGLAIARMIGHITYMSDTSMTEKFGRRLKDGKQEFKFGADFEVEGYLRYRGDNFGKRFDANSYLYITKTMDYFNLLDGRNLPDVFKGMETKFLVIAFKSDWLYPAYQSQEIARACKLAGVPITYCEIDSRYGHDAFLLEVEEGAHLIKHFLQSTHRAYKRGDDEG
ncbi:MAG: homoserine O-acetyltransferase [Candidatus Latescibacteria bacterium]|nr:homoserine O-acetyltransferase [Candidatus Latescibacterota bacterium]